MTPTKVTKAVFPVAGLGTRFLPATKASPKEMLTVVDKPLIQYAVEEAVAAGVTELIFVTGRSKPRRWAWATRCCARATWWVTSRSR
jgi:UTP-glucose-1-phosphate uridylyltransferase